MLTIPCSDYGSFLALPGHYDINGLRYVKVSWNPDTLVATYQLT